VKKPVYMGTTKIPPDTTAAAIVSELVRVGATSINTDYRNGQIVGIRWVMLIAGENKLFEMPIRVDPISKVIPNREQAERTAWRQVLRWVQAQNAMIEIGMTSAPEVYFAYCVPNAVTGKTLFSLLTESKFKMLEAPKQ
jgi:hypothetical protein